MALFNKQKQEKKKKGENVIGKIIYGFLLFAPLLNILVTCMYVTFNKNAYKSYSNFNEENNRYELVNNYNEFIVGNTYKFIANGDLTSLKTSATGGMNISNVIIENIPSTTIDTTKINYFAMWNYNNNTKYLNLVTNENTSQAFNIINQFVSFTFTFEGYSNINQSNNLQYYFDNCIYHNNIINTTNTLDNAFIYGTQKTEESSLFNWAKTTGTYTVLTNVTTGIGITNTFIPMLMAYWLLISVVYFLFDIALILVWMVHDKIHDLKDAI